MATQTLGPPKLEMTIKCCGKERSQSQLVRIVGAQLPVSKSFFSFKTSTTDSLLQIISCLSVCSAREYANFELLQLPYILAVVAAQVSITDPALEFLKVSVALMQSRSVDTRIVIRRSRTSKDWRRVSKKVTSSWSINYGSGF